MPASTLFRAGYSPTRVALLLLLATQLSLGAAQISITPLGHNVDEIWHFNAARNVMAACLRQSFGRSWTFFVHEQIPLNEADRWQLNPANPAASPCSVLFGPQNFVRSLAYYAWVGIPIALFNGLNDKAAADVGRFATLTLGLASTALTYRTSLELFPGRKTLALGAATVVGLNHHFASIMVGVNTDAGATFAVTLLHWSLARIYRRGFSHRRMIGMGVALLLCLFTKATAWIGVPIAAMWLWSLLPAPWRRWSMGGALSAAAVLLLLLNPVEWSAAAHWLTYNKAPNASGDTRAAARLAGDAPAGRYVFTIHPDGRYRGYTQFLPTREVAQLRGKPVTLAGWVWAPAGSRLSFPVLETNLDSVNDTTIGTGEWQFRALATTIPPAAEYIAINLPAPTGPDEFRFDGIILTPGVFQDTGPPTFDSPAGTSGAWPNGTRFANVLRNPSAEQAWPVVQIRNLPGLSRRLNFPVYSLLAWPRTAEAWLQLPGWIFSMFWSGFGGTQPGLSRTQLLPFAGLSLVAVTGLLMALMRCRLFQMRFRLSHKEQVSLWLLLISAALVWLTVILRADIFPNQALMFTHLGPRYGLPGLLPTALPFALGFLNLIPRRAHRWTIAALTLFLFAASMYILLAVQIPFINCPELPQTLCLKSIQ